MRTRYENGLATEAEWSEILFDLYKRCRNSIGWKDIFDCHDEEDQKYFKMLDEQRGEGKI